MNKKSFINIAFTALLDGTIVVYTAVTLIVALTGSFFLRIGPLELSIAHVKKPLVLVLVALLLRRVLLGKFFEGIFSYVPPVKYGFEVLLIWLKKIERWLTKSFWRGLVTLMVLGLLYISAGRLLQSLPFERGLRGEYFANTEFAGEPLLSARDESIGTHRFNQEFPEVHEHYSIRWTGFLYAPRSGTYTFSTASDDGSWLSLDGKQIVGNGGSHGMEERSGNVSLKRGVYPLEIRYVQQEGGIGLQVFWSVLDRPKQTLPGDVLFTDIPSNALLHLRALCRLTILAVKVLGFTIFVVLSVHYLQPSATTFPGMLMVFGILTLSFASEFWLLRKFGLRHLSMPWESLLWCVNFMILLLALGIQYRKLSLKTVVQNAFLLCISLSLLLGFFEGVLRTGMFDKRGTIWIREKYKKFNDEINAENWALANKNPYKFTDIVREKEKPAGISRIAVLGDSFVWGASIPYRNAWGHKLAQKVQAEHQNIEVMNWGYPGWSTADEFNFLTSKGIHYAPDLLLVGFVRNDPDLGHYRWKLFDLRKMPQWYVRVPLWPFRTIFPTVFDFTAAHLNEFLMNYLLRDFGYGWQAWYDKIDSPQNLQRYYLLVKKLADFCEAEGIRLVFILTPATYSEAEGQKLQIMASILDRLDIEYLNLFPATVRELSHYPPRQLWGNPGDPHPGDLMTELFATESFAYLEEQNILSSLDSE